MPPNNMIGTKISDLRKLREISVEELAERSQMSEEQIKKIENGDIAASLTPLLKIARALGVRLGTFLDDADCQGPAISTGQEADKTIRFAGAADVKGLEFRPLAANKRDRNMEPFIIDVHPPASADYELSSHEGEEFIYVLEGSIEVAYGKEKYQLESGQSIYYDSIVPHHVHATGNKTAKILAVVHAPY